VYKRQGKKRKSKTKDKQEKFEKEIRDMFYDLKDRIEKRK